jgi:DNA-directed RNA polymerase subunit RPC12/RpoP
MKALRLIFADGLSACCQAKALLVRSRDGGFVSQNCLKCGKPAYIGLNELPGIVCDCGGSPLAPRKNGEGNYSYKCGNAKCGREWDLPTLLPWWDDLFPYCGLAAPGDPAWHG